MSEDIRLSSSSSYHALARLFQGVLLKISLQAPQLFLERLVSILIFSEPIV